MHIGFKFSSHGTCFSSKCQTIRTLEAKFSCPDNGCVFSIPDGSAQKPASSFPAVN